MIDLLRFVSGLAADLVRRRVELDAENALLRQQLIAAERKIAGRVRWTPWQRFTIVVAARVAPAFDPDITLQTAHYQLDRVAAKWSQDTRRTKRRCGYCVFLLTNDPSDCSAASA
jgi:hypothetical protein